MKSISLENSLRLSFILIDKKEEEKFVLKLKSTIKMLNKISYVEVENNFEFEHLSINSLCSDQVVPSLSLESIRKLSNLFLNGYFVSPKILD